MRTPVEQDAYEAGVEDFILDCHENPYDYDEERRLYVAWQHGYDDEKRLKRKEEDHGIRC